MSDPTRVKHYEILSRLGEGGMGVVYRARDTRLGRTVALKMLSGEFGLDPERSQRFEREARIVSSMSHPGIATLFDFDTSEGSAFLTMELVEGPTLREVLEQGPMPIDKLLDCGAQVASAIAAAHEHGVVHRDIKPENVMVTGSGFYKVLDFGVARIDEPTAEDEEPREEGVKLSKTQTPTRWLTRRGMLMGTVAYMSPEQVQGEPAESRSDIFSLGSVLYELATGESAFARASEVATMHAIAYEEPKSLKDLRPDIPAGLALVISKCLAKKPRDRYGSAADVAADLELLRQQTHAGTGVVRDLHAYRKPRNRFTNRLAVGISAAVVLVALGWWASSRLPGVETGVSPANVQPTAPAPVQKVAAAGVSASVPRVIVAFFENHTGDASAEWISSGLPEMLTTDLARSPELEVIATQRLHDLLASAGQDATAPLDRSTSAELARWARADLVISGAVFKLDDMYRIDVQAYEVNTGTMAAAHKVEGTELFKMVEELTAGLLAGLTLGELAPPTLQAVTQSEEAFRAYTEGKRLYSNLRFDQAAEQFREAIDLDENFALPRVHLATSLLTIGDQKGGVAALGEALAAPESLPEDERLLAEGLDAYFRQEDFEKGAALLGELTERFPANPDGHVWFGRAASELEGDPMEGIRRLRVALKIDRDYLPAVVSLADEMTRLGAVAESQALLRETADRCPMAKDAIEALIDP
ncbi:MAG: protein kinase [Acidobacteria bacterium]|nr:protein kinase [Acidobacteriota bacterium]NIM61703.1 protein kinase [Acidobacteriota bacterium]NIO58185.1 protein kinase [Acidobacteriota bacterium]NIQ83750.1 protein kinase [Acidobacteriota bacterium]NIT09913.1 protein kinase [Acidobacteriota bacterium]